MVPVESDAPKPLSPATRRIPAKMPIPNRAYLMRFNLVHEKHERHESVFSPSKAVFGTSLAGNPPRMGHSGPGSPRSPRTSPPAARASLTPRQTPRQAPAQQARRKSAAVSPVNPPVKSLVSDIFRRVRSAAAEGGGGNVTPRTPRGRVSSTFTTPRKSTRGYSSTPSANPDASGSRPVAKNADGTPIWNPPAYRSQMARPSAYYSPIVPLGPPLPAALPLHEVLKKRPIGNDASYIKPKRDASERVNQQQAHTLASTNA